MHAHSIPANQTTKQQKQRTELCCCVRICIIFWSTYRLYSIPTKIYETPTTTAGVGQTVIYTSIIVAPSLQQVLLYYCTTKSHTAAVIVVVSYFLVDRNR
jgi:ADP-dependent phosphofructokinase/glucokinase